MIANKKKKKKKRDPNELCTWLFRLTTRYYWRKTKREIKSKTLQKNWKINKKLCHSDGDTNCNWNTVTVSKGLVQGLEDLEIKRRMKTIQTSGLSRWARILRRPLKTWKDLVSLRHHRKIISYCWSYLPTPPLGKDMTQGQFLNGVYRFEFKVFLLE